MKYVECGRNIYKSKREKMKEVIENFGKRDIMSLCSLRATRRILKHHWNGDIPESTVKEANLLFNQVLYDLSDSIIQAHKEKNKRYKEYHLRQKLRLCIYKKFVDEILKWISDFNMGVEGVSNRNTSISNKQEIEVT